MVEKCWLFLKPHESFRWNGDGGKQSIFKPASTCKQLFFSLFLKKVRKMCELAAACTWNGSLYPPKHWELVKTPPRTSWFTGWGRAPFPRRSCLFHSSSAAWAPGSGRVAAQATPSPVPVPRSDAFWTAKPCSLQQRWQRRTLHSRNCPASEE